MPLGDGLFSKLLQAKFDHIIYLLMFLRWDDNIHLKILSKQKYELNLNIKLLRKDFHVRFLHKVMNRDDV